MMCSQLYQRDITPCRKTSGGPSSVVVAWCRSTVLVENVPSCSIGYLTPAALRRGTPSPIAAAIGEGGFTQSQ